MVSDRVVVSVEREHRNCCKLSHTGGRYRPPGTRASFPLHVQLPSPSPCVMHGVTVCVTAFLSCAWCVGYSCASHNNSHIAADHN
jgi:hypothetical protein